MSTFGKKSLNTWDYKDHSRERALKFLTSKKEIQLEILKKWYPIGALCRKYSIITQTASNSEYRIAGYIEKSTFWSVRLTKSKEENEIEANPAYLILDKEYIKGIKRQIVINKLIDGE
jgi:hypothetical protein